MNEKLQMLHMDMCRPIRMESINRKRYILVIVDDDSRFTWVKSLRTKDEALDIIIKFLKQAQVSLKVTTSVIRTPQQNGVVERNNHTLVEAARIMLLFSKSSLFLWAEVIATECYTQNRSLIYPCYSNTPYELLNNRKPELKYLYIFSALCYLTNDNGDLGKLKRKADIEIFIGYSPSKKAY
ncbi:retrovirus-related pol polyprotein from transposon TNT 1-94 [Tanacetum coccineum]